MQGEQDTATFILHHYEASPYAEKIRAMFGLTGHAWGSVLSPPYPPRPNVDPLAGGYRRIPVAQLGADVFCDTALIAAELAAFTEHGELRPAVADTTAAALVERAEGAVFFTAITAVPPLKLIGTLLRRTGPVGTLRFVRDRTAMMKGASVRAPRGATAARVFNDFLADLDGHLAGRDTLQGENITYADFCVYHPIWLAQSVGSAAALPRHAHVERWFRRMQALGHGGRRELTAQQAFAEAKAFEPRSLPADVGEDPALGSDVSIVPADYGKVAVSGRLVAATAERCILARDTERFGTLHVHFPREGYVLAR